MKTLFASALLALGTTSALAQATHTDGGDEYTYKGHFFLDLQAGGQYTAGEASFGDLLSPNFQLGIGYRFTPVFGLRLQANGLNSKGALAGFRAKKGDTPEAAPYKFSYVAPGLDLMFNLGNLFAGWNPNRVVNATLFLGGGINFASGNSELNDLLGTVQNPSDYSFEYLWQGSQTSPFGRVGLDLEFKVSKSVSIMLEGSANFVSDKYNSKKGGTPDSYYNLLAGLRINLGKSYTKATTAVTLPAIDPVPVEDEEEPAPEYTPVLKDASKADSKAQPKTEPKTEAKAEPQPVNKTQTTTTPKPSVQTPAKRKLGDIFFTVAGNRVTESENKKILEMIDYLVSHPQSKVIVTSYADDDASHNRIVSVTKMLTKNYGIPADRFGEAKKAQRVLSYTEGDKDRIVVMVAK